MGLTIDDLITERQQEAAEITKRIQSLDKMIAQLQKERAGMAAKALMHNGAMEVLNTMKAQQVEKEKKKET